MEDPELLEFKSVHFVRRTDPSSRSRPILRILRKRLAGPRDRLDPAAAMKEWLAGGGEDGATPPPTNRLN